MLMFVVNEIISTLTLDLSGHHKDMADIVEEEGVLHDELKWLLNEEVQHVLDTIEQTLMECAKRFPLRMLANEHNMVRPQRILLASANGGGYITCVITIMGDSICEADITFKHKQGNSHHQYKTSIQPDIQWKLQQIQDAGNHLCNAACSLSNRDKNYRYKTAKQVIMLLDDIMDSLNRARSSLACPKRKSLDELLHSPNMQAFQPRVPGDIALSFYIHASKLILSLYQLNAAMQPKLEILSRHQVECSIQWLNEAVILLTVALQQCQQLKDKFLAVQQCALPVDS